MEIIKESHTVKTRKDHQCHGCYKKIPKGNIASSFTGKEDSIYTIYTCLECEEFINLPENHDAVQETYRDGNATEGWIAEWKSELSLN